MPVVVRRPAPPLGRLVTAITYRNGQQPRTSVEKILPGPGTSLWVNLNRDAFRSFSENHLRFPSGGCDVRSGGCDVRS